MGDMLTVEEVDTLARRPNSVVLSCNLKLNFDGLLEAIWDYLGLVRVYTKRKGEKPDFQEPIVLTKGRDGVTVESAIKQLHQSILQEFKYALVWGRSTKHNPQKCGLHHPLQDEDVLQIVKKTAEELRHDKNYSERVQAYYDSYHESKKKKKPLKT